MGGETRISQVVSDRALVVVVYILYLLGFFTIVTAVGGLVIAYGKQNHADAVLTTHLRFQIRTFWLGFAYLCAGWLLAFALIGYLVLFWWLLWTLIRVVRGLIVLNDNKPIPRPSSWLFG